MIARDGLGIMLPQRVKVKETRGASGYVTLREEGSGLEVVVGIDTLSAVIPNPALSSEAAEVLGYLLMRGAALIRRVQEQRDQPAQTLRGRGRKTTRKEGK